MAIKQHDENRYTKEYNDPIERYLKNIVQRYFEIENEISQESKEAIIIQAYTRLKETLNAYSSKYIICVNEKSGAIDLSIKDFGGEEAFDKKTAYNKDFCETTTETKTLYDDTEVEYTNFGLDQEDTIVSGDDDRLSDARIPLVHIHEIEEINGLSELLEEYKITANGFHLHKNFDVLEMIAYTGSRVKIDLRLLEDLVGKIEQTTERLKETDNYFINIARRFIAQLYEVVGPINKRLEYIDEHLDEWTSSWIEEANANLEIDIARIKAEIKAYMRKFLTKTDYDNLRLALANAVCLVEENTFSVGTTPFTFKSVTSECTKTLESLYHDQSFRFKYGHSFVTSDSKTTKQITDQSVLGNFYGNNINNGICKLFLEYTKDGISYRDPLPHIYELADNKKDYVLVFGETDSDNNINIYARRISTLPVYLYYPLIFNAWSEDNAGNISDFSYLQIDETDTTLANSFGVGEENIPKLSDSTRGVFYTSQFVVDESKHLFDLVAVNAPYVQPPEEKQLLYFTAGENYTGSFTVTMNTGHWYGFSVWESTDGINFTEKQNNYNDPNNNPTHSNTQPYSTTQTVTFVEGYTYKIATKECPAGGETADRFVYSFTADRNVSINVGHMEQNVSNDIVFSITKQNNKANLTWELENAGSYNYKLIKEVYDIESEINCNHATTYQDTLLDTLEPYAPAISGKCIYSDEEKDEYELTVSACDRYELTKYKLQLFDAEDNQLFESESISITSYSDIKNIHFNIGANNTLTDFTDNSRYELVSETELDNDNKKTIVIRYIKSNPVVNDKFLFCDNIYMGLYSQLNNYLGQYNCNLCTVTNDNQQMLKYIMLLQNSEKPNYHIKNAPGEYFDGTILQKSNIEWYYFGELNLKPLNVLLNNATIRYQLYKVPNKKDAEFSSEPIEPDDSEYSSGHQDYDVDLEVVED